MSDIYTTAIIVAAGDSTRMGYKMSKQLIPLCGRPAIEYTLRAFQNCDMIDEIDIVTRPQDINDVAQIAFQFKKVMGIISGGADRAESVRKGIRNTSKRTTHFVIHDGARVMITPDEICRVLNTAIETGAATLGTPVTDTIKVAVIGKPNVGKSSLVNRILGEERVIVSNVAGTTRDAVDSNFENEYGKYCFIDTAGMRKKSKVNDRVEQFSVLRATMAIDRADVCLILIDANEGVTEQDTKVAGLAHEAGKASIIVVNKWDAVEKDDKTMDKMRAQVRNGFAFMPYAPILFISALTGQRVPKLFERINAVREMSMLRVRTGTLNSVLADATNRVQPPTDKGRRLKIYYMTQVGIQPPHFVVFCNDARLFHFSYQRYLENQIRNTFGLEGTPIRLTIRQKGDKED